MTSIDRSVVRRAGHSQGAVQGHVVAEVVGFTWLGGGQALGLVATLRLRAEEGSTLHEGTAAGWLGHPDPA